MTLTEFIFCAAICTMMAVFCLIPVLLPSDRKSRREMGIRLPNDHEDWCPLSKLSNDNFNWKDSK